MRSYSFSLTSNMQPLIDFRAMRVKYFSIEVQNFSASERLEFAFGLETQIVLQVPCQSTTTRENFPLVGVLHGRTLSGVADIKIDIW